MPSRLLARVLTAFAALLIAAPAVAYDATKAPRYASPDMYRPNVDRIILNGPGSTGPVDGMSVTVPGGVSRSLADRAADVLNAADFGVKADGVTNDTAAMNTALAAAVGRTLLLPKGTILVDALTYAPPSNKPITLRGQGRGSTIIQKRTATPNNVLTIGSNPSPFVLNDVRVEGITFDGFDPTATYAAIEGLDLWRVTFRDVEVRKAKIGLECLSCIWVTFDASIAQKNKTGLRFNTYGGASYPSTPPNLVQIQNSQVNENTVLGIDYDVGALISLRGSNVEYNGTTAGAVGQGGIIIGPNVGQFNPGTVMQGLQVEDTWIEGNKGQAHIVQQSGRSSYRNLLFWTPGGDTTNDLLITGGSYTVDNVVTSTPKTANLLEGPNVLAGNVIQNSPSLALSIDRTKTTVVAPRGQGSRVRLQAASIANNADTTVSWGAAEFDDTGALTSGTTLTVPAGTSRVRVSVGLGWASNGTGLRKVRILKNGAEVAATTQAALGYNFQNLETGLISVSPGDTFTVSVYQNSGGALAVLTNQDDFFVMESAR
ncbi:glycoside hydrolase family 55 protein [Methylobacterium oryzae]|uniref:glycoside hydrolase family 55 protein n=1 Tax=Methylobacterium oryzae TaxID=334852 RepID=UPI001F18A18E|nr:glycoside hydrolase family 55 protein [Methylobacterium oryzae]UIN34037.1 glycoside hydrolase family 55 protein [Methylobacterium oryzae]